MLAVQPPVAGLDLAPTGLVAEATQHSKNEHQREERVHKAPRRGRGGKGDKGKGDYPSSGVERLKVEDNGPNVDVAGVPAEGVVEGEAAGFRLVEHRNLEGVLW